MAAVSLDAVHKMLHHSLTDLVAQMVIVHEDVPHGLCFQELNGEERALVILARSIFCSTGPRIPPLLVISFIVCAKP